MPNNAIRHVRSLLLFFVLAPAASPSALAFDTTLVQELKAGVTSWNAYRNMHKGEIVDLSGAPLKGMKLRGADFSNADLTGADLGNADLSSAVFLNARLESSILNDAVLTRAMLDGATLDRADLEGALLEAASCKRASLKGAVLKKADCSSADFSGANLQETNFREARLAGAMLSGADLRAAYFWRSDMSRAVMDGIRVSGTTILVSGNYATATWAAEHHAVFLQDVPKLVSTASGVPGGGEAASAVSGNESIRRTAMAGSGENLWRVSDTGHAVYDKALYKKLKSGVFAWNDMRKRNREMLVDLQEAKFDQKNLSYADISRAKLRKASFRKADMFDTDLRHADLSGSDLREANLEKADFGGADLSGANLWRANLSRARLNGVRVSGTTVLDSGRKATPEWAARHDALFIRE